MGSEMCIRDSKRRPCSATKEQAEQERIGSGTDAVDSPKRETCSSSEKTAGSAWGRGHRVLITGSVAWCFRCGAYASTRAVGLAHPCVIRTTTCAAQARMRLLLGLHPVTRIPLEGRTAPEFGTSLPRGYAAAVASARASGTRAACSSPQRRGSASVTARNGSQPAAVPLPATSESAW